MLHVSNVSKRFGDKVVLENVSFIINRGERAGLIGPNGSGKTTLLEIIAGGAAPDAGSVELAPGSRLGYLQQGLRHGPADRVGDLLGTDAGEPIEELAAALAVAGAAERPALERAYTAALEELETRGPARAAAAEAILAGLGLGHLDLDAPVATLSGGQKTRLALAQLLLNAPDILLLDEPTNHLDIEGLEWLEGWLASYRGAALIVSHDRTFLDATVRSILELDAESHTVEEYAGNYSDYLEEWERRRERQWAAYRDQEAEIGRMRADIHRTKHQALSVELTTTPGEPVVRRIAKKVAKKAKSRERKLERYLESDERVEKPAQGWQMKLEFGATPASGRDVLLLEDVIAGYDGVPLLADVNVTLRAGERVALVGPNGAGKTTLLRVIAGEMEPLAGRVRLGSNVRLGYYSQEQENLEPSGTPLEAILQTAAMSQTEARSFLHRFLFAGDEVFVPIGELSYGERARLALARLVAAGTNLLLLDEPINHLDIPSRTMFERGLAAFEGTVLAVVHDRYFIRQFASRVWAVAGGTVRSYVDLAALIPGPSPKGRREADADHPLSPWERGRGED